MRPPESYCKECAVKAWGFSEETGSVSFCDKCKEPTPIGDLHRTEERKICDKCSKIIFEELFEGEEE